MSEGSPLASAIREALDECSAGDPVFRGMLRDLADSMDANVAAGLAAIEADIRRAQEAEAKRIAALPKPNLDRIAARRARAADRNKGVRRTW